MNELQISICIYGVIGILTLLYGVFKGRLQYWRRRGIPHMPPHFLAGNLKGVGENKNFYELFRDTYNEFKDSGPFCGFYYLLQPAAFILDLELVKRILITDFNSFADRGSYYNAESDPLSANVFNLDAPEWRKIRTKLTPTFTSGKMREMFPMVSSIAEQCRGVFEQLLGDKKSSNFDVRDLMARYTTDVIGNCAFGLDCNSLKDPDNEFRIAGKEIFSKFRHPKLVHAMIFSFPKLAKKLGMCELLDSTSNFYSRIVRETIEYREKNNVKRNDFINMLIELKNSKDADKRLSLNEITANAFIFFVAGFETSSSTISFALYELAQSQKIQNKLRQEIEQILAKHGEELTYECLKEMVYLDQVISETLRKYSILPNLQRRAVENYDTGTAGYTIPKDCWVIIPVDAIQNDPEIYPQPDLFRPERFEAAEIAKRPAMTWLAFGDGPRNCIGMRFGKMQTQIGLITLLKNFRFGICKQTVIPMQFNNTSPLLMPRERVFLKVEHV